MVYITTTTAKNADKRTKILSIFSLQSYSCNGLYPQLRTFNKPPLIIIAPAAATMLKAVAILLWIMSPLKKQSLYK